MPGWKRAKGTKDLGLDKAWMPASPGMTGWKRAKGTKDLG